METTEIDLEAPGGELLGAVAYLAVLAYPESHRKRSRCVDAMLAMLNRAAKTHGRATSKFASELFAEIPTKRQGEILGKGQKGALRRIYRRWQAAEIASRALASGMSLNAIIAELNANESHFFDAVWSESKPVLHLALALRGIAFRWQDDGRPSYIQLLARPTWVRDAIQSAENWRLTFSAGARMQHGPEFIRKIDSDAFIRLVPLNYSDSPTTP